MLNHDLLHLLGAFAAGFLAGGINSVAGGGSMVSFPTLLLLGLSPVVANATNTVGTWPGSLGSMWGFRRELARVNRKMFWLLIPAVTGAIGGALLLQRTPPTVFGKLAPWLILFATILFIAKAWVQKKLKSAEAAQRAGPGWLTGAMALQLAVAVYGGYFGAGMSIMMLSVLGLMGMTDILEMSATTSLLACAINGAAGVLFAAGGLIAWPFALAMAAGALSGGYLAAGVARRIGKAAVNRFVILVGLTIATLMFVRMFLG